MSDATHRFFDALSDRARDPALAMAGSRIRFDVVDGERTDSWVVTVEDGDLVVSRDDVDAGCRVQAERRVFEALVTGETNVMAAVLRGELAIQGDPELLVRFRRLLTPSSEERSGASALMGATRHER